MKEKLTYQQYKKFKPLTAADGNIVFMQAILVNLVIQITASIVFSVIQLSSGKDVTTSGIANGLFMIVIQLAYLGVTYFNVVHKRKKINYFLDCPVKVSTGFLSAALWALTFIGFYFAGLSFDLLLNKIGYQGMGGIYYDSVFGTILTVIAACVLAPVAEELIFRGALLSGLKEKCGTIPSILLSGLAFSLMHMNPQQTVYQFFLGCVCAYAVIKSKSIWPAIIIHALNNMFAFILDLTPLGALVTDLILIICSKVWLFVLVTVLTAIICGGAIFFLGKVIKAKKKSDLISGEIAVLPTKESGSFSGERTVLPFNSKSETTEVKNDAIANADADSLVPNGSPSLKEVAMGEGIEEVKDDVPHYKDEVPEGGIMGKATAKLTYIIGIGVCLFMWLMTFLTNL